MELIRLSFQVVNWFCDFPFITEIGDSSSVPQGSTTFVIQKSVFSATLQRTISKVSNHLFNSLGENLFKILRIEAFPGTFA